MTVIATGSSWAGDPYIGAGGGASHMNLDCGSNETCDSSDSGFKAYAGYLFNKHVGVEAVYLDFGEWTARPPGATTYTFSNTGYGLAAVGVLNFGQHFVGFGRAGLLSNKAETKLSTSTRVDSKTSVGALFGIGVAWKPLDGLWIRAEIDLTGVKFNNSRTPYTDTAGVQLFTAGISYQF